MLLWHLLGAIPHRPELHRYHIAGSFEALPIRRFCMGHRQSCCFLSLFTIFLFVLLSASRLNAVGGVPVLLTFENIAVGSAVHTFPGLTLVTFGTNNFDGTAHFTIVQPSQGTVS